MNNDAGWCGSGGPWITPELSQKSIVWTETNVSGPTKFAGTLRQPEAVADFLPRRAPCWPSRRRPAKTRLDGRLLAQVYHQCGRQTCRVEAIRRQAVQEPISN